ncbi:MAG: hypothetical protein MK193_13340 [Lentisphaeria bacterium]|nr:hypothetical protein [Lentisphaeria bacterium]
MPRNFDPKKMFYNLAQTHQPSHSFKKTSLNFNEWKAATLPLVKECLGEFPKRVAPNEELIAEYDFKGLKQQRWHLDVGPEISATVLVNIPQGATNDNPAPAILCWHGHGTFGKAPVMGDDTNSLKADDIKRQNYDYGYQMAQEGFVTFAIDAIGFGERNPERKPNYHMNTNGRDWCNLLYLMATMFGSTSIAYNAVHGMAATDLISSFDFVDVNRLGVMGLSGGGTCTTWSYLLDDRFKAAEIICYHNLWEEFLYRDLNCCGVQVAPGLFKLVDVPDLQGLLAPKPLLIDIGALDTCFTIESSMQAKDQIEAIYKAADASESLHFDIHGGEHAWGGKKGKEFFKKYL